jgi:hypothetical protein
MSFLLSVCTGNFGISFVAESTPPVANSSPTHARDVDIDLFAVFCRNSQVLQQPLNDAPEP